MSGNDSVVSESVVVRSLRRIRDRLFTDSRSSRNACVDDVEHSDEGAARAFLDNLPVDMQFHIMNYLSPQDLCRLGGTSRYWRAMVQDPLLWKYFLFRDIPSWPSVDYLSLPRTDMCSTQLDFMAEYLRTSPACRRQWRQPRPAYEAVAAFLQSLVAGGEPRFAMLGPGLEQLDVSLMTSIMLTPAVLPVAGMTSQRQIDGVGSGISFMYSGQHRFNIITLYSTNSSERERARSEQLRVHSKLFVQQGADESGQPCYSVTPQVQLVCQAVDGFIFVVNAETDRAGGAGEEARAQIQAMLHPAGAPASRPLLVLSCISRDGVGRSPCVTVAHQLQLSLLHNPWMVQDTVAESLSGLLDGINWLLKHSGLRI